METTLTSEQIRSTDSIDVLHVDDETQILDLTATYIEKLNEDITVRTETDPRNAIESLAATPPDCIISDYQMPAVDGIQFLRKVREDYPNLPFILFTGKGSEAVASDAIEAGVSSYIQKGGTEVYDQLENRIANAVRRRRSERLAKIAEERLLALYEQSDGFYILDDDWRIAYWNQTIADRTGVPAEDAVDNDFWDVFPEASETDVYDRFTAAMETRSEDEFELFYNPHGYWAEVQVYPIENGLFVHSRDITEEEEHRQEIERRNRILVSFANTVSHDLRNPLSIAEGKLELAQETGDFDHLEGVAEAHNRMRNLIDELLRLARGEDIEIAEFSLAEAAQSAWDTVTADSTDLVIEDEDMLMVGQETQIRRLFENMFWNAIEHGGASMIRVGRLDGDGFYVEDDGSGISLEQPKQIFTEGFSTEDEDPGYGLSIVQGVVDAHDWEIAVKEDTASGARFEITGVRFAEEVKSGER